MLIYLIIIGISLYLAKVLIIYIGYLRSEKVKTNSIVKYRTASIIVPARNEEENIEKCVRSIFNSDYDHQNFELICINDRSEDKTGEILQNLQKEFSNLKIVNITDDTQKGNLVGKAGALHQGILKADGEILMMTDADCVVHKSWISSIMGTFNKGNFQIVPSFTKIRYFNTFSIIQAVEWIYMHSMAKAGIGLNKPLGCFGNNLSITKEMYQKIGGYENIDFSVTEDYALLKATYQNGGKAYYICEDEASVTTEPCFTFSEYISQHRRWALGGLDLGWIATTFVVISLSIWIALVAAIIKLNPLMIIAVFFVRIFGDYLIAETSMSKLNAGNLKNKTFLAVPFFMFIELILPFTMLKKEIKWKGQTFKG